MYAEYILTSTTYNNRFILYHKNDKMLLVQNTYIVGVIKMEQISSIYFEMSSLAFDLLIFLIMLIFQGKNDEASKANNFFKMVSFNLAATVLDLVIVLLFVTRTYVNEYILRSLMSASHLYMPVLSYLFLKYVSAFVYKSTQKKLFRRLNICLLIASAVLMAVNVFIPIVDSQQYILWNTANGPLGFIIGIITLYYTFVALAMVFRHRTRFTTKQLGTILIAVIFMIVGIVLSSIFHYGRPYLYFFTSLALYIIYFSIETPDYRNLINTMRDLRIAEVKAQTANEAKSSFLANTSHEIRTPINAILGMNELILRESDNPAIIGYAKNISASGNALLALINDILDISKIESGKMELVDSDYELSSIINDAVNMVAIKAQQKGLDMNVNVDPELPEDLYGDESRLRQAVINILNNAVKYTRKGYVGLDVSGVISGDMVTLKFAVSDTGIGIKKSDMAKLFKTFQRLDLEENRNIEGTGLGLAITWNILKLMGGNIDVKSTYGDGSTFTLTVPQKIKSSEKIGNFRQKMKENLDQNAPQYHQLFTAPDAAILVVDDTEMNLTVVKGLLKKTKIQIDTCESGYDCLDMIRKRHYDVIFLDYRMPNMDGIQTLDRMQDVPYNKCDSSPVICLTANAISGAKEKYLNAGFTDYLSKPIDPVKLEEMLIKYLPPEKIKMSDASDNNPSQDSIETTGTAASDDKDIVPGWLHDIEGLDISQGITNTGSPEDYMDVLNVFAGSLKENIANIQNSYDSGDWDNYNIKVHAMKSSARIIGLAKISEDARKLEADSDPDTFKMDEINAGTPELIKELNEISEKLAPLTDTQSDADESSKENDGQDNSLTEITDSELKDAYATINELSSSLAYEDVKTIINQLKNRYILPDKEKERINNIDSALEKLDWDEVKRLTA